MTAYIASAYISTISILFAVLAVTIRQFLKKKAEFASKSNIDIKK
jgi:hypothetical protein